jgi:hypothetical protein
MSAGAEKRQHHRFLARLDVRIVSGDSLPADLKLQTVDVGVGGASCAATARLEASTRLHLILTLVGGDLREPMPIGVDAVVLRCGETRTPHPLFPFEAALQFVRIEPGERRRLQTYLNSL